MANSPPSEPEDKRPRTDAPDEAVAKPEKPRPKAQHGPSPDTVFDTVEVDLDARLGAVSMTVREILDLKAGAVVALAQTIADPVELRLGDKVVARGEIVTVDDHFAVRITELREIG